MARISTGAAIRAALEGRLDDAAAFSRRLSVECGMAMDQVHHLRQIALALEADELIVPLDAAFRLMQDAYVTTLLAWRRLEP